MNNPFIAELEKAGLIFTNKAILDETLQCHIGSLQSLVIRASGACNRLGFSVYKDPREFSEGKAIETFGRLGFSYQDIKTLNKNLQTYPWAPDSAFQSRQITESSGKYPSMDMA